MMTNRNRWGVYDAETLELVEGGFFARAAAEDCADQWREETRQPGAYVVRRQRLDGTAEQFK